MTEMATGATVPSSGAGAGTSSRDGARRVSTVPVPLPAVAVRPAPAIPTSATGSQPPPLSLRVRPSAPAARTPSGTDSPSTPTSPSLQSLTSSSTPSLLAKRKNRNKKGLALVAEAAKPGTLSNTSVSDLLATNPDPSASSLAAPPGRVSSSASSTTSNSTATGTESGVRRSSRKPAPIQVSGSSRTGRASIGTPLDSASSSASSPSLPHTPGALSITSASSSASIASASDERARYHNRLSEQLATLELGVEFKLDLRSEDLEVLEELGSGNGGTVTRCRHIPTRAIMAKKVVHIATSSTTRKQILRELQIMHDCSSPFIVSFYGAYLQDPHICMCMEFMDKGSLDSIYKKVGPIPEPVLGKIALAVVTGLTYLYDVHKIMHRDVKPSNILLNSAGQIKICDFGVSGELINSIADTFVGTSTYMSPERISGEPYTVKSDVWSLGITLVELAIGRFPFSSEESDNADDTDEDRTIDLANLSLGMISDPNADFLGDDTLSPARPEERAESLEEAERRRVARRRDLAASRPSPSSPSNLAKSRKRRSVAGVSLAGSGHQMSILELLQYIVNEPAPRLPPKRFGKSAEEFVDAMLRKEPVGWNVKKKGPLPKDVARPTPKELLEYAWMSEVMAADTDVEAFARSIP